jgi:3-oxoacyl-[acyl-carrier protein] reductase
MSKGLIIGGNSGIGAGTYQHLKKLRPDVEWLRPEHHLLDVRYVAQIKGYVRHEGPFQYIVYSAGVNKLMWARDIDTLDMDDIFDINVRGFIQVIHACLQFHPRIISEDTRVSVVAVSSDAAHIPMRGSVAYCASKAALEQAVRCLARELAPVYRVNAVAPGMVAGTAMTEYIDRTLPSFRGWTEEFAREYEHMGTPTGKRATIEEVAEAIAWVLLGPEQMTGAIVPINGGRS